MLLTYKEEENSKDNSCYLDTGANDHICGIKEFFAYLNKSIWGEVTFGDSSKNQ